MSFFDNFDLKIILQVSEAFFLRLSIKIKIIYLISPRISKIKLVPTKYQTRVISYPIQQLQIKNSENPINFVVFHFIQTLGAHAALHHIQPNQMCLHNFFPCFALHASFLITIRCVCNERAITYYSTTATHIIATKALILISQNYFFSKNIFI